MTDDIDTEVAKAKIERIEELDAEVNELLAEIDRKIERIDELQAEAEALLE